VGEGLPHGGGWRHCAGVILQGRAALPVAPGLTTPGLTTPGLRTLGIPPRWSPALPSPSARLHSLSRVLGLLVVAWVAGPAASPAGAQEAPGSAEPLPRTAAEVAGFHRHTSHLEMMEYLGALSARFPHLRLERWGTSREGRALVLAVLAPPGITTPAEAHASGLPVVVLGANVHGFNHVVREGLLLLLRELATPGTGLHPLLDEMVIVVAPSLNPDGLEAESRFNARGSDLNRDYILLEEPETRAWVGQVLNRWEPHLVLDGHDGGADQFGGGEPYHLLYQGPGIAGADPRLAQAADRSLFPELTAHLAGEELRAFYWSRGDEARWLVGGSAARMGRNHGGLAGRLTVLFEVASWPGFQGGVEVAGHALEGLLRWTAAHGPELVQTVREVRQGTVALGAHRNPALRGTVPVAEEMLPLVGVDGWEIPDEAAPGGFRTIRGAPLLGRAEPTRERVRPWAWILPPEAGAAVEVLLRQGVVVEELLEEVTFQVQRYESAGVTWGEGVNHLAATLMLEIRSDHALRETLPAGSWVVRAGQPLGRLAAHLLEPETGDNLYLWGVLTPLLPGAVLQGRGDGGDQGAAGGAPGAGAGEPALLPVARIMEPGALPRLRVTPADGVSATPVAVPALPPGGP
jgi:hypothetical protein